MQGHKRFWLIDSELAHVKKKFPQQYKKVCDPGHVERLVKLYQHFCLQTSLHFV